LTVTFWEPDAPTLAPAAPAFDVDVVVLVTAARISIIKAMQRDNKKVQKRNLIVDSFLFFFLTVPLTALAALEATRINKQSSELME